MENIITFNTEKIYSVLNNALFCCFPKREESEINFAMNTNKEEIENLKYNNDEFINGVYSIFPSKYIREDEKKYFKFTQGDIIKYITELSQQNFINKYDDTNTNIQLSILDHNELSNNTPVIRSERIIKKSFFKKKIPTIEDLVEALIKPEVRLKVDKNFKEFEIIKIINENAQIVRMVSTPQLTMISEREFYDKKTFFFDNGVFYYFCSSIPDDIYPPKKEPVRVLNYFGAMIIKEDIENFYIDSFNQVDIKMNIPEVLIVMSYPLKMKEVFDGLMNLFNN